MKNWFENLMDGALGRFLRVVLNSTVIMNVVLPTIAKDAYATFQHQPIGAKIVMCLGPGVITAVGKRLRDAYPGQFDWLPF